MAYAVQQDNYRSKRSYVSTASFNGSIYSYVTALNPTTFRQEGRLVAITTSPDGVTLSQSNCPAGRVLRENGRKLYPGVNPGLAVGDTYQGSVVGTTTTNHFWVGVFDAVTGVKGFINPNSVLFTVFNSDKSLEIVDQDETVAGLVSRTTFASGSATLASGTVTVTSNALTSSSKIMLTRGAVSGVPGPFLSVPTFTPASGTTSGTFVILAGTLDDPTVATSTDDGTVNWLIVNSS